MCFYFHIVSGYCVLYCVHISTFNKFGNQNVNGLPRGCQIMSHILFPKGNIQQYKYEPLKNWVKSLNVKGVLLLESHKSWYIRYRTEISHLATCLSFPHQVLRYKLHNASYN